MSSTSSEPPSPTPSFVLKNVTIDDIDSSLEFSQGWNRIESSSAHGGSFQTSDTFNVTVSFSLPARAIALYYFGYKQASGAFYGACLDCSSLKELEAIDAHDDAPTDTPALLYTRGLDPDVHHSLILVNAHDPRFGDESIITLDSFVVTVRKDETNAQSGEDPPSTSPTTQSILSTGTPSADAESGPSAGERKLRLSLMLVGVLIAVLLVLSTLLFALMYFRRRRKRRKTAPGKMFAEGHWATRFFGNGNGDGSGPGLAEKASIWLGGNRSGAPGSGSGVADHGRTTKGHMVEKTILERSRYRSLSSPPTVSPSLVSDTMRSRGERKWIEPAYTTFSAPQSSSSPPRSSSRSPFTPASGHPSASPRNQYFVNDRPQLTRMPPENPSLKSASHEPTLAMPTVSGLLRRPSASSIVRSHITETITGAHNRTPNGTYVDSYRNPYMDDSTQHSGNGYPNTSAPQAPASIPGYAQFDPVSVPGAVYGYGREYDPRYWYGFRDQGRLYGEVMQGDASWGNYHGR